MALSIRVIPPDSPIRPAREYFSKNSRLDRPLTTKISFWTESDGMPDFRGAMGTLQLFIGSKLRRPCGERRQAERDAVLALWAQSSRCLPSARRQTKAPSTLRSAGAVHNHRTPKYGSPSFFWSLLVQL